MRAPFALHFIFALSLIAVSLPAFSQDSAGRPRVKRPAAGAAQPASANAKASGGVAAVVRTDGALVYDAPDFDGKVLATLAEGQKIRVSKGTTGSYAKFHKVRVGPILGYIAEIDVQVEGAPKKRTHKRGEKKQAKKKRDEPDMPMMFSRFVGLLVGQVSYKEGIQGSDADEGLIVYGLKVTGPDVVWDGPIADLNIALHYGAPSYYDKLSATKPSGFALWIDPDLLLPFVNADNHMFYLGAGPLIVLSSFKVTNSGRAMDLTALNIGAAFELGAGFRIDKVAVRLEGKYYLEKQSYKGVQLSIQSQF